jgi:hypothetical protein
MDSTRGEAEPIASRARRRPRGSLAGRAMWVCLAWYVALVAGYLAITFSLPDPPADPDCGTYFCDVTLRDVMLYGGAAVSPVLLLCFVASTIILTRWVRRGGTGAGWIGFGAAAGGLLLGFGVFCAAVAAKIWL